MDYVEHLPAPRLRPFVRCLWRLRAPSPGGVERILPDGCAEIVLNRADPFRRVRDGHGTPQPVALAVGQLERPLSVEPTGAVDLAGVRFEPGGLFALLGAPMHELTGRDVELDQLDRRLAASLAAATTLVELEEALVRRLDARGVASTAGAGLVGAAMRAMERGATTAGELTRVLAVPRRSLERLFRNEVGLAPKRYLRVRRFQSLLRALAAGRPARGWADLAAAHGFADQSHLIREFRALAGTTPQRHLAERTPLAGCFEGAEPSPEMSHSSNR